MLATVLGWSTAAEVGVGATVAVILAWRSPQLVDSFGRILKIILTYHLARKKVPERAKSKQANLRKKIEGKRAGKTK